MDRIDDGLAEHLSDPAIGALQRLQDEIDLRRRHRSSESYLDRSIDFLVVPKRSYQELEALKQSTDRALLQADFSTIERLTDEINDKVQVDVRELAWQKKAEFWGGTGLKAASVFFTGGAGLVVPAAIFAADQARPANKVSHQVIEFGLGAAAGALIGRFLPIR